MVEKEKPVPCVYIIACAIAIVIYPVVLLSISNTVLMPILVTSFSMMSVLSAIRSIPGFKKQKSRQLFLFQCFSAGLLIGSVCAQQISYEKKPIATLAVPDKVSRVSGTILSDPVPYGKSLYRCKIRVNYCIYQDRSRFGSKGLCTLLIPGELIREMNPGGIGTGLSKGVIFSIGTVLETEGEFGVYSPEDGESFFVRTLSEVSPQWVSPLHQFRAMLRLSLMRILYDWGDAGGFLLALLSGNRDYLAPTLADSFRATGISHILALSGMHLSIISMVAIRTGKRIGGKRFSIRLSLFALLFFVWFAGASPSLSRALIMSLLLIGVKALGFKPNVLPILAATFILQTLASPSDDLSLAFVLSYGALWGILTFGVYLSRLLNSVLSEKIHSGITASVGAQLMTTPVIAVSIGYISPIGIIVSCLISPMASIFLVGGILLTTVTIFVPSLGYFCSYILNIIYQCIVGLVDVFVSISPLSIQGTDDTIVACIIPPVAGLILIISAYIFNKRRSPDVCLARL